MKIDNVAADLLRQAKQAEGEIVRHRLERGLVISAKRIDRQWHLAAARPDVYPSDAEAVVVARAFGVPLGTEPEWTVRKQKTALAVVDWHGIVWKWLEEDSAHQPALLPEPVVYA